jgi:glucose-1-phosphate adenylyltransferase
MIPTSRKHRHGKVLSMILAGGEGTRLLPLTAERAKPAVPFGGRYRIIDFVLSNFVNSGLLRIKVLTQYKSESLNGHLSRGWHLSTMLDQYIEPVPAQQRIGKEWYRGSADAIYQNINLITDEEPDVVCVFGGDHVYKMDVGQMLDFHFDVGAELTVAAIPVPVNESKQFGVIEVDHNWRMIGFEEKPDPSVAKQIPGQPGLCLASMGNYIFSAEALVREVVSDASREGSVHDFGRNIITNMFPSSPVYVYDFMRNDIPGVEEKERGYWKDVGTLDTYWQSSMDLIAITPVFNLYNRRWPIRTAPNSAPPAKFVFSDPSGHRQGFATDSMVSEGCIISGGRIDRSILGPGVRINSFSWVEESILFDGVDIGRHARIRRAIVDKDVRIPAGMEIGYDHEADRRRGLTVSEGGVVVVPKGMTFENR